jgi:hypothetical protein
MLVTRNTQCRRYCGAVEHSIIGDGNAGRATIPNEFDGGVLLRDRFQPILQSVANTGLGYEKAWPIRVRLDLLT